MIDKNKVYHVYPTNDIKEHILECAFTEDDEIKCKCECEPDWKKEGDWAIIVHNSFDGREGLEWTKEHLKNTTPFEDS